MRGTWFITAILNHGVGWQNHSEEPVQWHCGNCKCCHVRAQGEGVTHPSWSMCLCSILGHSGALRKIEAKLTLEEMQAKTAWRSF